MPCNSDYMYPHDDEIQHSRVLQLLDEVDGKRKKPSPSAWEGYDKRVYNKGLGKADLDANVALLCKKLRKFSKAKIQKFSLELQMWWRDHQKADRKRRSRGR